jgi:hypothetical protein
MSITRRKYFGFPTSNLSRRNSMTDISGQTEEKMKDITLSGPHRKWIGEIFEKRR